MKMTSNVLERDQYLLGTKSLCLKIGIVLLLLSCGVMDLVDYFASDYIGTKVYFYVLAVGLVFIGYALKDLHWFFEFAFWIFLYHLVDEIAGTACVFSWFEVGAAFITLIWCYGVNYRKGISNGQ